VEIYNLNRSIKTSHLDDFLLDFQWGPTTANLKWVDDEHALAVFPCAEAAQALLHSPQSTFLVRPYSKASSGSLQIPVEGEMNAAGRVQGQSQGRGAGPGAGCRVYSAAGLHDAPLNHHGTPPCSQLSGQGHDLLELTVLLHQVGSVHVKGGGQRCATVPRPACCPFQLSSC
jgi:hypothetical protein